MIDKIDKEFMNKLIENIIKSKSISTNRSFVLIIRMPKKYVEKLNEYLSTIKLSFLRLFVALLREYAEDEETRKECLKHMPIEYDSSFTFKKDLHLSRAAYDILAIESNKIKMNYKALATTLIILFLDRKVIFKSEALLSAIFFENLI